MIPKESPESTNNVIGLIPTTERKERLKMKKEIISELPINHVHIPSRNLLKWKAT